MSKEVNLFEYATRNKVRFNYKGVISTEDLWDLNLEALSVLYGDLKAELLNRENRMYFVQPDFTELENKIAIVKHIADIKNQEIKDAEQIAKNKEKKKLLIDILAQKENEEYKNMSKEELIKLIDSL